LESTASVDDDDIRDYLVENPDYFQRHQDLLSLLQIPHASGAAVSLVERQVSVLRERNVDLRHRLRDLGATAKENDHLFAATRALVLALIDCEDLASLQAALLDVLHDQFDTEYASLLLFGDGEVAEGAPKRAAESEVKGRFGAILGARGAGCGALRAEDFSFLFGGSRVTGSAAVALVEDGGRALGLLAVGSSDAARYDSDMDTLFLEFATELIARILTRLGS
jgi:uncharacterized protein YigA (DUF484 family)